MTKLTEDSHTDELVSASYQELARETVPEHLNEAVLRRAAAKPSATPIGRSWFKPLAWVATLGLSLAIVLELTRLPEPASEQPAALEEAFATEDLDVVAAAEDEARRRDGPNQEHNFSAAPAFEAETDTGAALDKAVTFAEKKEQGSASACNEVTREVVDSWLACIEALRNDGRDDDANAEYDLFREQHPDILPNK